MMRAPPGSTLFPYPTLFRSDHLPDGAGARDDVPDQPQGGDDEHQDAAAGAGDEEAPGEVQGRPPAATRSEEHTSELQSQSNLVCRLLLEKKKQHVPSRDSTR